MKKSKVDKAIILAAGLGSRMRPVTNNLPKPLVKILGKRIIETALDALLAAEITDIYVVCGYLAEKFQCLKENYPTLKFLTNNQYRESNNISSILCAKDLIRNAYVIEGDLFLKNPSVITPFQSESNYLGIYKSHTDDWCFYKDKDGYINKLDIGGNNCYQMAGISYWTAEDGAKLASHAEKVFSSQEGRALYWDEIALTIFKSEYKIAIRECAEDDVVEIDTFQELQEIDSSYLNWSVQNET